MDYENVIQTLTYIVTMCAPFSFLFAIIERIYKFIINAVTGGHKFM